MKNLYKSTIILFALAFLLGGAATVAKIAGYGDVSDYALGKANELAAEIQKAKAQVVSDTVPVSATIAQ